MYVDQTPIDGAWDVIANFPLECRRCDGHQSWIFVEEEVTGNVLADEIVASYYV